MKCARCGFENPEGFTFCGKCGSPLTSGCPRCGFENPPGFAFCGNCGAPLGEAPDRLTSADLDHMRAYLPPALVEGLQFDLASPPAELLEQCITHLSTLLETVYTHLPPYLVEWVLQDPTPGKPGGHFVDGTLLFADISGFTAMSERLSRIGREGAEEINVIVNRYFSTMLSILREHHGQLVEFGGDALLGLFFEPDSATRAVQTAQAMQTAMGAFTQTQTSQGVFSVQMKVGIHRGRFFAAQLGTARGMEFALFGADVSATAAIESAAEAGQILIALADLQAMSLPCRTRPAARSPYLVVEQIEPATMLPRFPGATPPEFPDPTLESLRRAVELLDALTPYLPAGLLGRLASDPHAVSVRGEHRLAAILFANVFGLGDIADRLGPGREEQIVAALNLYHTTMERAIHRFGGVINTIDLNAEGDKLFVSFGAPLAHEDDAERAVRAALAMQETLSEIGSSLPASVGLDDLCLSQRIGISFGYVFAGYVGTNWRRDYSVMGDDTNLAARLMSKAEPGAVIVSGDVRRKVQALFELSSRGDVELKGKAKPVTVYSVTGPRAIPEPLRGLKGMRSALVGRESEWEQLTAALNHLQLGRGQVVSVIGEAGLGKSRLVDEARQAWRQARWIEGRCLSYTESVSFWPFEAIVRRIVGIRPDDSERVAWSRLLDSLDRWLPLEERRTGLPYLASFLNLPLDEAMQEQVRYLDAEALQRRAFVAIGALIEGYARAESAPLVLVLEDIHWLDQASLALLEHLLALVNRAPVMYLLLYRPERAKACWQVHEKVSREFSHCATEIALQSLTAQSSHQLLANLVGIERWPAEVRDLILSRTEGNPLYLEEVLRSLIDERTLVQGEGGQWRVSGELDAVKVPDTLQGVLMARLDRLAEASRWTAQVASVVGRVFPFDILAHIHSEDRGDLTEHLVALQQYEVVHEAQRTPELVYAFKHGMMQEVCYRSLLTRTRRRYHRRVAEYLEAHRSVDPTEAESNDALIGHHAYAGHDWPRALQYQLVAGQEAQQLFANHEAVDHYKWALESAENLDSEETTAQRLEAHAALGELLTITSQYEEALEHLQQALALAVAREDRETQATVCRWLARLHEQRGEYPAALDWIQQGLEALGGQETAEAAELLLIAGLIRTRQGEYDDALQRCQEGLRIAQELDEVSALARAYNLLGVVTRHLGMSAMAVEHFERAFALYERAGDLQGQAISHNLIANAHFDTARWDAADQHYRQAREIFGRIGNVYRSAFVANNLGGIAKNRGRLDEALAFYREGLESLERIGGSPYVLGVFHMNLGATFVRRGEVEAARQHLRTSREYFERAQARGSLAEMHRHCATAALLAGELAEAGDHARQALELAREMSLRGEEGSALRTLGEIDIAQGQFERAEEQLQQSLEVLEQIGDEYERARTELSLARLHTARGDREAGLHVLDRCIPTFEQLGAELDLGSARALRDEVA
jgi:class 3 adenylate cyclase/predicted ATPase